MTKKKVTTESEIKFIIEDSRAKMHDIFSRYDDSEIAISYSGGSDSDIMMHFIRSNGYDLKHVFFNTGIEYRATLEHIENRKKEGADIDTIRGEMPIPTTVREYGLPFISKSVSEMIQILQRHDFDFQNSGDYDFETLVGMYPNSKTALRWWTNTHGMKRRCIANNRYLKEFLVKYGVPFKVSSKCCDMSKKRPVKKYSKENNIRLNVVGLRRSEAGVRVFIYKTCFYENTKGKEHMYFPLYWWTDDVKEYYKNKHNISYSDCYEVYGLDRTGCAGCPYGRKSDEELLALKKYEPKLYKGVNNIFKESHDWTRKYREFASDAREKGIKPIID